MWYNTEIDCDGVKQHIDPCGSFFVSPREREKQIEELVEEMEERDRE